MSTTTNNTNSSSVTGTSSSSVTGASSSSVTGTSCSSDTNAPVRKLDVNHGDSSCDVNHGKIPCNEKKRKREDCDGQFCVSSVVGFSKGSSKGFSKGTVSYSSVTSCDGDQEDFPPSEKKRKGEEDEHHHRICIPVLGQFEYEWGRGDVVSAVDNALSFLFDGWQPAEFIPDNYCVLLKDGSIEKVNAAMKSVGLELKLLGSSEDATDYTDYTIKPIDENDERYTIRRCVYVDKVNQKLLSHKTLKSFEWTEYDECYRCLPGKRMQEIEKSRFNLVKMNDHLPADDRGWCYDHCFLLKPPNDKCSATFVNLDGTKALQFYSKSKFPDAKYLSNFTEYNGTSVEKEFCKAKYAFCGAHCPDLTGLTGAQVKKLHGKKHLVMTDATIASWNQESPEIMYDLICNRCADDQRFADLLTKYKYFLHQENRSRKPFWGGRMKDGILIGENKLGFIMEEVAQIL